MSIRILCASDIHIGRRSSRVSNTYRSVDAWNRIVKDAIDKKVDLVALGGDVIDQANKSYEALGSLRSGLRQLASARIEVVAVSGNHDWDILHRLLGSIDSQFFHLLGENGQWERFTLLRDNRAVLHVDGWSFPSERVVVEPLRSYNLAADHPVPLMILLHGEVDTPNSSYAPIRLDDLWSRQVDFALLGHIHAPREFQGPNGTIALYAGSPYALDPGEPGVHGYWLAEISDLNELTVIQNPISPVRYLSVEIDFTGIERQEEFQNHLANELERIGGSINQNEHNGALEELSLRVSCFGTSSVASVFNAWVANVMSEMKQYPIDGMQIQIDKIDSRMQPPIHLENYAKGNDPVSEIAHLILGLNQFPGSDSAYANLVDQMIDRLRKVNEHQGYQAIRGMSEPSAADAIRILTDQAWEALSILIEQKDGRL